MSEEQTEVTVNVEPSEARPKKKPAKPAVKAAKPTKTKAAKPKAPKAKPVKAKAANPAKAPKATKAPKEKPAKATKGDSKRRIRANTSGERLIGRIEQNGARFTPGYQVKIPANGNKKAVSRWFGEKKYGSQADALKAAVKWRNDNE